MTHRRAEKELFSISVVAELFDLTPQTLRLYETHGLLEPQRSEGGTRLYSRADLERLQTICHLINDLGVNLAGVEVILKLMDSYQVAEQRMMENFREVLRNMQKEFLLMYEGQAKTLVRISREFSDKYPTKIEID
jgi:MerR family transcriptional regulator, heat shock protein HspR